MDSEKLIWVQPMKCCRKFDSLLVPRLTVFKAWDKWPYELPTKLHTNYSVKVKPWLQGLTYQIEVTTTRATCRLRCLQLPSHMWYCSDFPCWERANSLKVAANNFQHFERWYCDGRSILTLFIKRCCNINCKYHTNAQSLVIKLWSALWRNRLLDSNFTNC